ncbi:MAG: Hpt domain-containing protein [Bacteroidales bacterium]
MKTDLSYLNEMSGGNQVLILEMIGIFKNQVVEFVNDMEQHLRDREYEKLGKLAHKAKSSISIMGLTELAAQLKNLELMACAGIDVDKYAPIIERFKKETTEAVSELDEVTKNLELYF